MSEEINQEEKVEKMIDDLVKRAKIASEEYLKLDQKTVDNITKAMSMAGLEHHMELAKMAVEETGRGIYEDKITKNMFATEYIYHSIKHEKTVGIIKENEEEGYVEIAEPVGIIAGVTPVTNPTSTTMFKSIISAKTRNVIIFGFHPSAQKCSSKAAEILRDAAVKAGAPKDCILWIEEPSILATRLLMNHPGVNLILATGGTGMVKSAYSCGKPALGVGPGNVPCYIDKTAKLRTSVNDLVLSKAFDNGMICASEQAVLVDRDIYEEFEKLMKEDGCYFVSPEEKNKLQESMFEKTEEYGYKLKSHVPGQSPCTIAKEAGFEVPEDTKVLVVYEDGIGEGYPFSKEKLSPVLTYYIVNDSEEGISKAEKLLEYGGLGHSAVIHSEDKATILKFSKTMKAGRIIVNSPSTHGAIGDIYNTNMPSLTLGCGSYGSNSTTANVSSVNLINIKRVAKRRVNMQWFKVPEKIYFEAGSISYLEKMPNIEVYSIRIYNRSLTADEISKNYEEDKRRFQIEDIKDNPSASELGYVSNGLMCLYDGEYNSEFGKSKKTKTWYDLSKNNNNATLKNFDFNKTSGWTGNSLLLDGKNDWVSMQKIYNNNMTVEIALKMLNEKDGKKLYVIDNYESGGMGIEKNTSGYMLGAVNVDGSYYTALSNNKINDNTKYSLTLQYDGSNILYRENDIKYNTYAEGRIKEPINSTRFVLGVNASGENYDNMESSEAFNNFGVYSVRIYNRALTDEEISQNYNVDKERFGI